MSVPLEASRTGRRAQRLRQRRRARLRSLAALLAVAVLALVAVTVYFATRSSPPSVASGQATRTQRTLLLQLRGGDGSATGSAVLAHDPAARSGAVLLVPRQLLVTVPGAGTEQLARTLTGGSRDVGRVALADLLGLTVDDGWVLSEPAFAALVDRVGGVTLDVDTQVVRNRTVLLGAGPGQRLDGGRAVAYATYLGAGEQEQARLARLQKVLTALIAALPKAAPATADVLRTLGSGSSASVPPAGLAALMTGLASDELQTDSLPVVAIDPGNGVSAFRLDTPASDALVDRLLAQSVPPGRRTSGNRVLVLNGVGTPGLGSRVRAKLVPAGLVYVGSRNAPRFGYDTTRVLIRDTSPAALALGAKVAAALGVPESSVQTSDIGSLSDVVVLVGADFKG